MKVSVIIPSYNRACLLQRAVDSVLAQTYQDFEILVVDDGSKDETRAYMLRYTLKYPKKIRYFYKENGGVSSARNMGILHATGEYISFLDSDDYLKEDKIKLQLEELERENADACYCGSKFVWINGREKHLKMDYKRGNIALEYLAGKIIPNTNSWLIKRDLIQENMLLFQEGHSWGEDMEFFVKVLFCSARTVYVRRTLVAECAHEGKRLSDFSWDKLDEDIVSCTYAAAWLKKQKRNISLRKQCIKVIYGHRIPALLIYRMVHARGDRETVKKYFTKYHAFLSKRIWCNGLRSLKLCIYWYILRIKIFLYSVQS